jgi:hypothetical protein
MIDGSKDEVHENLVVYYWTNLALLEQGKSLDQQTQDFINWSELQKTKQETEFNILAEFTEKHLKRTKPKHFPELKKAVELCLKNNACLVIVKLDGLISQTEFADLLATPGLNFTCIDKSLVTPQALAVVRQYVAEQSKQHGDSIKRGLMSTTNKLGNPNAANAIIPFNKIKTENSVLFALLLQPIIVRYQKQNLSQRAIVDELNASGIRAPGGRNWVLSQLQKVLKRIATNNLAIQLTNEINVNNYENYSAVDLITKLNQEHIKPSMQVTWDEHMIVDAKNRNQIIENILEIYNFMQTYSSEINRLIAECKNLDLIAEHLNTQNIRVPQGLLTDQNKPMNWDKDIVEQIIKRMNNELKLPYDGVILKDFCTALQEYSSNSNNAREKAIYEHKVLRHLIEQAETNTLRLS